ncbi:MAG TPA: hypothetical protein VK629_02460 [Steroidobacteraceae bacterium]|nr:hypothetical protein [Steroidobacteraceae bacterium]
MPIQQYEPFRMLDTCQGNSLVKSRLHRGSEAPMEPNRKHSKAMLIVATFYLAFSPLFAFAQASADVQSEFQHWVNASLHP